MEAINDAIDRIAKKINVNVKKKATIAGSLNELANALGADKATGGNIYEALRNVNSVYSGGAGSGDGEDLSGKSFVVFDDTINMPAGFFANGAGKLITTANFPSYNNLIPTAAFQQCSLLTEVNIPACTSIGAVAFQSCSSLTSVNFPVCTNIGPNAFQYCSSLASINFPVCTTIGSSAFYSCSSLIEANFPACTYIGSGAFQACYSLTSVSFPVCTSIESNAFQACSSLTSVNFPACITISDNAFSECTSLTEANFPACTSIGIGAFTSCSSLTEANFPACTSIPTSAFYNCYSLTTASFPACTSIGINAFVACFNLLSLYLTGSTVCTLSTSNVFSGTPIEGYTPSTNGVYGSIYVPASLYNSYKTASNWSYFADRFVSIA